MVSSGCKGPLNCVLILQLSSVPPFYFWGGGAEKMSPYSLQNEAVHKFGSSRRQRGGNCLCLASFLSVCIACQTLPTCNNVWVYCRIKTSFKVLVWLKLNLRYLLLWEVFCSWETRSYYWLGIKQQVLQGSLGWTVNGQNPKLQNT